MWRGNDKGGKWFSCCDSKPHHHGDDGHNESDGQNGYGMILGACS